MRDGPSNPKTLDRQGSADLDSAVENADEDAVFPTARGVLTAAEIEALLRPETLKNQTEVPPLPQSIEPQETVIFDEALTKTDDRASEHYRVLGARMSRALALGTGLKAAVTLSEAATIERTELPALLNGKSSAIACLGPSETDIHALVCLPPTLSDAIIAKACGARGSTGRIGDGWTLSAIDCALLEQLLVPLGDVIGDGLKLQSIETDIPYVCSLLSSSNVSIGDFSVEAPGLHSELAVIQSELPEDKQATADTPAAPVPVTAVLTARLASLTVPLSRITELKAGATLLLGLPADQPVELLSGGRDGEPAFEGRMGRKSNKVAVKITKRARTLDT
ncbi:MAG: FliM/FliN family flagellar motor switch protein [Henriciella sp.]